MARSMKGKPMTKKSEEPRTRFTIRMPSSLTRRIQKIADKEGVSLNAWIVSAMESAAPQIKTCPCCELIYTGPICHICDYGVGNEQ